VANSDIGDHRGGSVAGAASAASDRWAVGRAEGGRAIGRRKSHRGEEADGWATRRRTGMQGGGRAARTKAGGRRSWGHTRPLSRDGSHNRGSLST
jgi:hypothetical protein